jgi:hypothetical protein
MSMGEVQLQPDTADVLQEEGPAVEAVPVCITDSKAPVRVQVLPRKGGATMTRDLTTTPLRVLSADHRRASATVIATGADDLFLVAFTETAAQAESTMTLWPGRVPFETDATTEVWLAVPADPGTGVTVGISTQLWAEGEPCRCSTRPSR